MNYYLIAGAIVGVCAVLICIGLYVSKRNRANRKVREERKLECERLERNFTGSAAYDYGYSYRPKTTQVYPDLGWSSTGPRRNAESVRRDDNESSTGSLGNAGFMPFSMPIGATDIPATTREVHSSDAGGMGSSDSGSYSIGGGSSDWSSSSSNCSSSYSIGDSSSSCSSSDSSF